MARILIIDDEEIARFTIREMLEVAGHDVTEAANGQEGLERQSATPFDLIITDIIMPKKEGVETTAEMRQAWPKIGIIAISGGGRTRNLNFLEMARRLGADDVLAKPFTREQLLTAVDGCLSKKR